MKYTLPDELKQLSEGEVQKALNANDRQIVQEAAWLMRAYIQQLDNKQLTSIRQPSCALERVALRLAQDAVAQRDLIPKAASK